MNHQFLSVQEILEILRRNRLPAIIDFTLCVTIALLLAFYLPKKFKATSSLNIQASYFQNRLLGDLISGVDDSVELKAQRDSLLRLALSDDFIDELGEKYHLFQYPRTHRLRLAEREEIRTCIQYFSLNPTTYEIDITASDAIVAYEMNKEVLRQMVDTLFDRRYQNLIKTRDAIQSSVQDLNVALSDVRKPVAALKNELGMLEAKIQTLTSQFTAKHPDVRKLQLRADTIRSLLHQAENENTADKSQAGEATDAKATAAFRGEFSRGPTQDVFNDLLRKLYYLNVVLEMEKDRDNVSYLSVIEQPSIPATYSFPKKRMFVIFGIVAGLVVAAVHILFLELRLGTFRSPQSASEGLGIPFLGELPALISGGKLIRLVEGPSEEAVRRTLPYHQAQEG